MAEHNLSFASVLTQQRGAGQTDVRLSEDRRFRWIVAAAVLATYGLIVFGGIVRVTESGLGCPDWPLCYGQIIPPLNGPTLIEYVHRLITTVVTPLILLTTFFAWRDYRKVRSIFVPAVLVVVLLAIQIVLGGITVLTELHDGIVSVHLGNAVLLFALLLGIATQVFQPNLSALRRMHERVRYRNLALGGVAATFILIVIGALVRGEGAGPACMGFPKCGDVLIPQNWLGQLHMIHRLAAVIVGLFVIGLFIETWRMRSQLRPLMILASIAGFFYLSQFAVGIAQVTIGLTAVLRASHLALATALWGSQVVLSVLALQPEKVVTE